jgi:hypothetical protein
MVFETAVHEHVHVKVHINAKTALGQPVIVVVLVHVDVGEDGFGKW